MRSSEEQLYLNINNQICNSYLSIYLSCYLSTKKATLAVGKNHKVLLLMMRAFAPFATTASDATITCGLGSGLGNGRQSKNSHSYFKLILYSFLPYG